jgi:hypothetical protein
MKATILDAHAFRTACRRSWTAIRSRSAQSIWYRRKPYVSSGLYKVANIGCPRSKRQMLFIEDLHDLGWLDFDAFEQDAGPLELAIARYHQYLDVGPHAALDGL